MIVLHRFQTQEESTSHVHLRRKTTDPPFFHGTADVKQQSSWSNSCAQLVGYNSCAQVLVLPALQQEEQQSRTNMVSGSAFDRDRSL